MVMMRLLLRLGTKQEKKVLILQTNISKYNSSMPWPFCPNCRMTLKVDASGDVQCDVCRYQSNLSEVTGGGGDNNRGGMDETVVTTYSMQRPTPIWAKSDAEQAALRDHQSQEPVRATIEEACIKCNHAQVGYYTVQLRSVDEGQTVFYECPNCKHTWSINN